MAERLVVRLNSSPAGHLERAGGRRARFVPVPDGPALTVAARGREPWSAELTRAWFEGLLPEGETRVRAAGRFGVQPEDWFGLLAEIGWECAGAVSIQAADIETPPPGYQPLTDAEVGERLDALPGRPYDPQGALRMSLGGAQDKLVLAWRDGAWALPLGGAPSTHILKPEPPQWAGLVAAEAWALRVAGTVTPAATARDAPGLGARPVLVVTRFDRRTSIDGSTQRLHQEDLCQALGLLPSDKYHEPPLRPQKPSLGRLAAILASRGVRPTEDLERLLEQVVVRLVLGDADAHAKNWSILHEGGGLVRLSPMYDVVPTAAFIAGQRFVSLPVGGRFRIDEITSEQVLAEAVSWGIPSSAAQRSIASTLARLRDVVERLATPGVPERAVAAAAANVDRLSA